MRTLVFALASVALVVSCSSSDATPAVSQDAGSDAPIGPVDSGIEAAEAAGPCIPETQTTTPPDIAHTKAPIAGAPTPQGGLVPESAIFKATTWVMYHDGPVGATNTQRQTLQLFPGKKFLYARRSNQDPDTRLAGTYDFSGTEITLNVIPGAGVCQYPGSKVKVVYTLAGSVLTTFEDNGLAGTDHIIDVTTYTKQ